MTRNGALAGIVVGAGTVIAWKLIAVDQMGSGLYEMVPGFIAATVAIVLISKLDREPPEELQVRHQQVRASQIGRAHVWTPVTNAHRVCRLLLEKKKHEQ